MLARLKQVGFLMAVIAMIALVGWVGSAAAQTPAPADAMVQLGQALYFDQNLSEPAGQACAGCHEPTVGFDDPDANLPVSEGVVPGLFGGRNSPISAYAMYAPQFHWDAAAGLWVGGQFWDGRATGAVLGDPLADQALGPFLNPVEMANPNKAQVIQDVRDAPYADLFLAVWGDKSLYNVNDAYDKVALSIAAFERSALFAQFSSKYDAYLARCLRLGGAPNDCAKGIGPKARAAAGKILTVQEWAGLQLFMGAQAMCSACHVADWTPVTNYALPVIVPGWAPAGMVPPVFTDFTFDNLGVPQNTEYPLDPNAAPDLGLGAVVGDPLENGKFKVMTLRDIGLSAPYAHNGYFKTLEEIVHFYNTRDVPAEMWPPAEVPATVNNTELGDLGLSLADEAALVAFLKTLDDGYIK